eukprot:389577-Rhodomonas_salina.5
MCLRTAVAARGDRDVVWEGRVTWLSATVERTQRTKGEGLGGIPIILDHGKPENKDARPQPEALHP